jgi:hypothetical protein
VTLLDRLTRKRPNAAFAPPAGFTAVMEALRDGGDLDATCATAGRSLAEVGAGLDEVLDRLEQTYRTCGAGRPPFRTVRVIACAWAESSLEYLNGLSCEDPLTGLATSAHLRTRLGEVYRAGAGAGTAVEDTHALIVVELTEPVISDPRRDSFDRALRFAGVVEAVHAVYPFGEAVSRIGARRVGTLVRREPDLGYRVDLLRRLLADRSTAPTSHRVWIEGLPTDNAHVGRLLDDVAR